MAYTDFDKAFDFVILNEGGYSNDKDDKGGATNYGITQGTLNAAYNDKIVTHNNIKKLKKDEAKKIYEVRYWKPSKADIMSVPLCILHFDAAVNHGTGGAGKLLQRTLNDYGASLTIDGVVGEKTIKALKSKDDKYGVLILSRKYCDEREKYYYSIVAANPSQNKFLKGWLNRLKRNRELIC